MDQKFLFKHDITPSSRFDKDGVAAKDQLLEKMEKEKEDLTEQLGELTLRQIQMKKDKTQRWFPIFPDSKFKSTWDLIAMLIICYQAIVIPYRFCFKARAFGPFKFYEFLMDIFFIIDLCKTFKCLTPFFFL
jgi:hypothetical protein